MVAYHLEGLEEKLWTYQAYGKVYEAILPPRDVLLFCQLEVNKEKNKIKQMCMYLQYRRVEEFGKKNQHRRGKFGTTATMMRKRLVANSLQYSLNL